MVHYATLNNRALSSGISEAIGAVLCGRAGRKIASICNIVFDHGSGHIRYLVADCGHDRRVLIPPERVIQSPDKKGFVCEFTLENLARLPVFNDRLLEDPSTWRDYEQLYQSVLENTRSKSKSMQIDRGREPGWREFEQRLRQELRQIRRDCEICSAIRSRKIA